MQNLTFNLKQPTTAAAKIAYGLNAKYDLLEICLEKLIILVSY